MKNLALLLVTVSALLAACSNKQEPVESITASESALINPGQWPENFLFEYGRRIASPNAWPE